MRRAVTAGAASVLLVSLSACSGVLSGGDGEPKASATKGDDVTIGLLLPEKETTRYEKFDYPIIKKRVAELTNSEGRLIYANAGQDAKRQSRQLQKMIDEKVDALLVDPVDAHAIASEVRKAKAAGIKIIAYDRLAEGPVDAYIGFDNELVGQTQARALLKALGDKASKSSKIVMINGSPSDPNAAEFKSSAREEFGDSVTIAKSYDTVGWKPKYAQAEMEQAISALGASNIAGVYSANDGMAAGIIKALKNAGVTHLPPVTGQDAQLDAVQRILTGEQYMSVYKPYPQEAQTAAEMAVRAAQGRVIEFEALAMDRTDSPTTKRIRTANISVVSLTRGNIKSTVVKDGIYKVSDICTPKYAVACAQAGLTK
ncbi:sugar ABC transporter substrate-binding protein [Streptomyces beihaiensis]|uniref:Substrate-binding domain-containing protein n=1 Tax=Streptomyces beihaiensis TaxID=2984495 RepID=A0ABT3TWN2_9ACTN|nr:substrate-binding domain-containing protein [Streptomyces beihaiensis]MCX3060460.1 substrate-binding domain-containing protein [Streptomyces beihaiensis]